ncbi:M23 family metallopeptidase [Williamsia marianensis]|uniref:M23 family metallopeptidase n=1 Tax=Williamsia TaxID=85043 RepID=UPI00311A926B
MTLTVPPRQGPSLARHRLPDLSPPTTVVSDYRPAPATPALRRYVSGPPVSAARGGRHRLVDEPVPRREVRSAAAADSFVAARRGRVQRIDPAAGHPRPIRRPAPLAPWERALCVDAASGPTTEPGHFWEALFEKSLDQPGPPAGASPSSERRGGVLASAAAGTMVVAAAGVAAAALLHTEAPSGAQTTTLAMSTLEPPTTSPPPPVVLPPMPAPLDALVTSLQELTPELGSPLIAPPPPPAAAPRSAMPTTGTVTSGYGARWGTSHDGLDIANTIGTPVISTTDGVVIESGPANGFGLWIRIRQDDGTIGIYGHINETLVTTGQQVSAGEQIATVGNRGYSTGPHLHYEVWAEDGTKLDPVQWLGGRGVEVG